MAKSTVHFIKLISISFVVIVCFMCHKPENRPVNNNPCDPGSPSGRILCFPGSPSNGAIVSPGSLTIIWRTVEYSTSSLYFGTRDNLQCISQQSSQSFVLKNLDPNTTYYWYVTVEKRCYSCSTGISSFTTAPDADFPYVITAPVFTHMNTPPRVGGNVLFEGSSKLSESGIYFGLSPNPDNGGTKFQIDNSSGIFSDLLTGLNSNTTYYIKAYATNSSGTGYGSEVSFTSGPVSNYKSIQDIEGNIYYTINIGNQVWMAENLRSIKFTDGTIIPNIPDDLTWETLTTPAYCWYNNNPGFKNTYGALYNWYTIDTTSNGHKNVCPTGWHLPDDTEWAKLITYLGGEAVAGIKLKETGDYYWLPYSTTMGDNSSDFSALAGGWRFQGPTGNLDGSSSTFFYMGDIAAWWSITSTPGGHWLEITAGKSSADTYPFVKNQGHSIRCIKDTT